MWLSQEEVYRFKMFFVYLFILGIVIISFSVEIQKVFLLSENLMNNLKETIYWLFIFYTISFNFILLYNRRLIRMYKFKIKSYHSGLLVSWYINYFISIEEKANVIVDKQKLDFFIYFLEKYEEINIENKYYADQIYRVIHKIYENHLLKGNYNRKYYNQFLEYLIDDFQWFLRENKRTISKEENENKFESWTRGIFTKYEKTAKEKSLIEKIIN